VPGLIEKIYKKQCVLCNKDYTGYEFQIFCSKKCSNSKKGRTLSKELRVKNSTSIKCIFCNKVFNFAPYSVATKKFCSGKCYTDYLRKGGNTNPAFGKGGYFKGKKHSLKTIKQMKETALRNSDKISKRNSGIKNGMYGKTHTEEVRKRLSRNIIERMKNNNFYRNTIPEKIYEELLKFSGLKENIDYFKQKNIEDKSIDFYIPLSKTCVFIDGDFWHCNPKKFNDNFLHPRKQMTAKQIWEHDKNISSLLQSKGYKVVRIWESEINAKEGNKDKLAEIHKM